MKRRSTTFSRAIPGILHLDAPVHEAEDVAMGDLLEGGDDTDEDVMKDSLREEITPRIEIT